LDVKRARGEIDCGSGPPGHLGLRRFPYFWSIEKGEKPDAVGSPDEGDGPYKLETDPGIGNARSWNGLTRDW